MLLKYYLFIMKLISVCQKSQFQSLLSLYKTKSWSLRRISLILFSGLLYSVMISVVTKIMAMNVRTHIMLMFHKMKLHYILQSE